MALPSTSGSSVTDYLTVYVGVNGVARKIGKSYVGVNGIARRIRKAYVGVGGVARLLWEESVKVPVHYGTAENMRSTAYGLAATTVGDLAIFGGGYSDELGYIGAVYAYDRSLTMAMPIRDFSQERYNLAATTVGNYALFGGGYGDDSHKSLVEAYDTSFAKTTPSAFTATRSRLAATTVGNYALFGGGYNGEYGSDVWAYDTSLTRSTAPELVGARCYLAATTVGNYALFGGGEGVGYYTRVDAYDTSLTRTAPVAMTTGRSRLAATTVGEHALFGGGINSSIYGLDRVEAYDISLTKTVQTQLLLSRCELAATTVGNYALFGGGACVYGDIDDVDPQIIVDAYDASLTKSTLTGLSQARYRLAATTVGEYAFFGGGSTGSVTDAATSTVDVYNLTADNEGGAGSAAPV